MADKLDYTKVYKDLYLPKKTPSIVAVPAMPFIYCDGTGSPDGDVYQNSVAALYAIAYTIKFSHKSGNAPKGYFAYAVPPLEGLWFDDPGVPRESWRFTSMVRQPDFVTPAVYQWALEAATRKKPDVDFSGVRYAVWEEGLCAQVMHIGPYADEPATIEKLMAFIKEEDYVPDFAGEATGLSRRHHEIYLGDPRKAKPENRKTVLRHPVRRI